MIDASHLKEKEGLQTDKFKGICEAFFSSACCTTSWIEAAQKNIPFKRPGTGSANPGPHSDLSISNVECCFSYQQRVF